MTRVLGAADGRNVRKPEAHEFSSTRLCSRQIPDKASSTLGAAQNTDARLPRHGYTSTLFGRLRSRSVDSSEPR